MCLLSIYFICTYFTCLFCVSQPGDENIYGPRESVLEFEDLHLLPLRDIAVQAGDNFTHPFGFSVGPVCFS